MASNTMIYALLFSLISLPCLITAQQPYASTICPGAKDNTSSTQGYNCNGVNKTCQTYLIYRTYPPYNTLASIAALMSVNASQVSAANQNVSLNMTLDTNIKVVIPVTCSCAGKFYQANTTYLVQDNDNPFVIANNTFSGLTTCNAIQSQRNSPHVVDIFPSERLTIPLRCACPTKKQAGEDIKYLMSFIIQPGNAIAEIATYFGANVAQTLDANEKSEQDSVIQPFTTLLVPLQAPPNSSIWEYTPLVLSPSSPLLPSPPTSTPIASPPGSNGKKKWVFFGVGVVAGGAFVLLAGMILLFILLRNRRKKTDPTVSSASFEAQEKALGSKAEIDALDVLKGISSIASLKVYSFKDLQAATENFSSGNWIKGSVSKGVLDGNQVAIKKMNGDVSREISLLNKINHFNLVNLLGVCFNDGVWYLVYEYAVNGPLSDWIYQDNPDGKTLIWGKRMQVASDVATGLNYLHSYTSPPVVHKDININNIFLDGDFRAKIAKLGLSRPINGSGRQFTLTKHIIGTKGYLAPEYLENGLVSSMLDVYSFGVLLLEMVSGKDVATLYEGVKVHLSEILAPLLSEGDNAYANLKEFIDPSLGEDYPADVAMSIIVLVDRCLRKDPGIRPSMDEIERILSKTLTTSLIWGSTSVSTTTTSS